MDNDNQDNQLVGETLPTDRAGNPFPTEARVGGVMSPAQDTVTGPDNGGTSPADDTIPDHQPMTSFTSPPPHDGAMDEATQPETSEMTEETDFSEGEPQASDVPEGMVAITVTKSATNPVPVYVNGTGPYNLRRDEEQIVPEEVFDALANSGVEFDHRLAGE